MPNRSNTYPLKNIFNFRGSYDDKLKILNAISLEDRIRAAMPLLDKQTDDIPFGEKRFSPRLKLDKKFAQLRSVRPKNIFDGDDDHSSDDLSDLQQKLEQVFRSTKNLSRLPCVISAIARA